MSVKDVKQVIKPFVPDSLLLYRHDRILAREIEEHKKMSRTEIEAWLVQHYREKIGGELDLANPQCYTEKIQWCKLNAMSENKSMMADKFAVRDWVANRIGSQYLIPLVGVWDSPDDIDFEALPKSFVLKTTHGSSTNIIVPDKSKFNISRSKRLLRRWLGLDYGWIGFEHQYMRIPPKVICEEFISNSDGSEALDYKFHCFGGKAYFVWVDVGRHSKNHTRVVFDMDWRQQDWRFGEYLLPDPVPEKPACFDELVTLAETLAGGLGHVRVDFYVIGNRPLFGEMTFSSDGGFSKIYPEQWDYKLGSLWDLTLEDLCQFPRV